MLKGSWDAAKNTATGGPCLANPPPDFHQQPLGLRCGEEKRKNYESILCLFKSHGQGSGFHSMLELRALAGQAYLLSPNVVCEIRQLGGGSLPDS